MNLLPIDIFIIDRAYNVNKLMPFQVKRLFELADLEAAGPASSSRRLLQSTPDMEETISRGTVVNLLGRRLLVSSVFLSVTKRFNESSQFSGDEEKMAYVVREPIVRGTSVLLYADCKINTQ